jgi:hypothetical protein
MVVYSYLIDPGHDQAYYEAHIQAAAPYSSIIAGIPLMFLAGWWVGGWWQGQFAVKGAVIIWLTYTAIDVAILVAAGTTLSVALLAAVSIATKLAAVYLGAVFANSGKRGKIAEES